MYRSTDTLMLALEILIRKLKSFILTWIAVCLTIGHIVSIMIPSPVVFRFPDAVWYVSGKIAAWLFAAKIVHQRFQFRRNIVSLAPGINEDLTCPVAELKSAAFHTQIPEFVPCQSFAKRIEHTYEYDIHVWQCAVFHTFIKVIYVRYTLIISASPWYLRFAECLQLRIICQDTAKHIIISECQFPVTFSSVYIVDCAIIYYYRNITSKTGKAYSAFQSECRLQ